MNKKYLAVLAVSAVMALASCGGNQPADTSKAADTSAATTTSQASSGTSQAAVSKEVPPATYERADDDDVYDELLGDFEAAVEAAHEIADDDNRYAAYAKAEAMLLANGIMVPTYTQGGTYAITRVAPKTISAAMHGLDSDRLQYLVARKGTDKSSFITVTDRNELKAKWQAAADANDSSLYDPVAFFKQKGWEISKKYTVTESRWPTTTDVLSTYRAADTEQIVNCVEGLVEYDNVGKLVGAMAKMNDNGLPYILSEDGKTYTFNLRQGYKWVDNNGNETEYEVTADDFVAGLQHGLDSNPALGYLVFGVIKNAYEYYSKQDLDFGNVGIRAKDKYTLEIELEQPESFFPSRLVYSIFMPINRQFFLSKGGAFGRDEFKAAKALDTYVYGKVNDPTSNIYNSAFYPTKWETTPNAGEIKMAKNSHFYNAEKVQLEELQFIYDDGKNPDQIWNQVLAGTFNGSSLSALTGTLDKAKNEGLFDTCAYISDTNATTFFGSLNVNRGAFEIPGESVKSLQSEAQKSINHEAFMNLNFRRGFLHGINRAGWRDVAVGEGVGKYSLRNMYTPPEFCKISKEVTIDGKTFPVNTSYGAMTEYFINQMGGNVKSTADSQDGWFNAELAKQELAQAKAECKYWGENDKIHIEKVYYTLSPAQAGDAQAFKKIVEDAIGDYVVIDLLVVSTEDGYYAAGYDLETGVDLPQDFFDGSGWGPDYLDPSTYLDTFSALRDASMLKVCGIDVL